MMDALNNVECECLGLRQASSFAGWNDFDAFVAKLKSMPEFLPVPVEKPYSNVGLVERWYQCSKCGAKWRLVEPDPPFAGLWAKVS